LPSGSALGAAEALGPFGDLSVFDLGEQDGGSGHRLTGGNQGQQIGVGLGPGQVGGIDRGADALGAAGHEGHGDAGEQGDQRQAGADDHSGAVAVRLQRRPRGGFLQVFIAHDPEGARGLSRLAELHGLELGGQGFQTGLDVGGQLDLQRAGLAALGHDAVELGFRELDDAVDEVAQDVGQVLVRRRLELLPGEGGVRVFRAIGGQVPAPVVGGQQFQRLIHEDAPAHAGRELAAVPVQPVESLQLVHRLPRLARAQDGRGEADGVEGHIVLAHELDVAHGVFRIGGALVQTPPRTPVSAGLLRPLLG
uniref:RNA polymerase beta subunit n=1 Tax=Parastrongyloides trichosuri TaxID=131310 RepID=A0A0N4Z874_PARTI